jgi:maleate isomerase
MQNDNWGYGARLGLFIVGAEAVPEAEWWAMVPPGVSVHAARVTAPAPWAPWRPDRSGVDLAPDLARGAAQFVTLRPHAVVMAQSSSSVLGGTGWDDAVTLRLAAALPPGTHVTANGADCRLALRACGVRRPLLVLPPWFGESTAAAVTRYFTGGGVSPAGTMRAAVEPRWLGVPPDALYAEGMHVVQRADLLRDQIAAGCPTDADGVLIVGTGLRCVGIIADLEATLGRPVVTANQASLWHCLRLTGIAAAPDGYGSLFTLPLRET